MKKGAQSVVDHSQGAGAQRPTGPQIQRREKWLEVPEYEGFKVRVWVNAPQRYWSALRSGNDEAGAAEAFAALVLEHNGWLDFDGDCYPPAGTAEFFEAIPTELAATVIALLNRELAVLPSSLAPTRRR